LFENAVWGIWEPVWNPGAVEPFNVSEVGLVDPPVATFELASPVFELAGESEKGVAIPVLDIGSH
jgi:hypothetical protein